MAICSCFRLKIKILTQLPKCSCLSSLLLPLLLVLPNWFLCNHFGRVSSPSPSSSPYFSSRRKPDTLIADVCLSRKVNLWGDKKYSNVFSLHPDASELSGKQQQQKKKQQRWLSAWLQKFSLWMDLCLLRVVWCLYIQPVLTRLTKFHASNRSMSGWFSSLWFEYQATHKNERLEAKQRPFLFFLFSCRWL